MKILLLKIKKEKIELWEVPLFPDCQGDQQEIEEIGKGLAYKN